MIGAIRYESCPPEPIHFHEYAEAFPMMEGEAFDQLKEDIRQHGVREPIVMYGADILDGRNRYMAARSLGIKYPVTDYLGDDPRAYVVSLNIKRRHLSESQRSTAAAKLANAKQGERTDLPAIEGRSISQADAAAMLNVSVASVERAAKVVRDGVPELVHAVETGSVSVSAAAEVATLPPEEQAEIVAAGPEVVKEVAKEVREGKHVRGTLGTGDNEWYTPAEHVELARAVLGKIDLDPASSAHAQQTVKAADYFTEDMDGLKQKWRGNVWMNPPYAQPFIAQFADKLVTEIEAGRVTQAIALTHNYTDTAWFQKLAKAASAICFTRGRVKFVSPAGDVAAPTQGQAFFYFGPDAATFTKTFRHIGFVAEVRI